MNFSTSMYTKATELPAAFSCDSSSKSNQMKPTAAVLWQAMQLLSSISQGAKSVHPRLSNFRTSASSYSDGDGQDRRVDMASSSRRCFTPFTVLLNFLKASSTSALLSCLSPFFFEGRRVNRAPAADTSEPAYAPPPPLEPLLSPPPPPPPPPAAPVPAPGLAPEAAAPESALAPEPSP